MAFSQDMSREAIAERIQPVAKVRIASDAAAGPASSQASAGRSGEQIYNQACVACHATGVLGAPKKGSAEDWEPRLAQGMDIVLEHSINGLNAMPPRGTCMNCSDEELLSAIEFMIEGI
ncbi:cytochrome c5 family protein [Aliidiomarina taiwanensis]|uniref:Cytochrome c5 family protein n=2 Tax=Aliidiomarina taiwanensis TaxID=946228 RepID=A0A432WVT8_9GAMM|nr:cytochrome c5 family protein [Aliidiomarina taiwanensis]RUO37857.1 cytochrome c5 family protein [Aliidiomarina taiwanensis]